MIYKCKVIAGNLSYEKDDIHAETAIEAAQIFLRHFVPRDAIIIAIEIVDVERTVMV